VLGVVGAGDRATLDALGLALAHPEEWVAAEAARVLGVVGAGDRATLDALRLALSHPGERAAAAAARALGVLGANDPATLDVLHVAGTEKSFRGWEAALSLDLLGDPRPAQRLMPWRLQAQDRWGFEELPGLLERWSVGRHLPPIWCTEVVTAFEKHLILVHPGDSADWRLQLMVQLNRQGIRFHGRVVHGVAPGNEEESVDLT
jgi:hypothetical protein